MLWIQIKTCHQYQFKMFWGWVFYVRRNMFKTFFEIANKDLCPILTDLGLKHFFKDLSQSLWFSTPFSCCDVKESSWSLSKSTSLSLELTVTFLKKCISSSVEIYWEKSSYMSWKRKNSILFAFLYRQIWNIYKHLCKMENFVPKLL